MSPTLPCPRAEATPRHSAPELDVEAANARLERMDAATRAAWGLAHLPGAHVLSSSFGAQSAVALHLLTRLDPAIPVILVDTGYLFAETYHFIDALSARLQLNLKVYQPACGRAWMEARHGQLWTQGLAGIERYNQLHKVEPMQRALAELGAGTWFTGLRRSQAASRAATPILQRRGRLWKLHPLADWNDRDIWRYLKAHDLPYHPLWEQGYVSIGDAHTTRPLEAGMREEDTRFFGLKRECGLHVEI